MAWLSDLVGVLAEVTGIGEPTVAQIARHVREAGFISSGGRGRSAAKMTAEDCANLLIAVMVADQAKNAPEYVASSSKLRAWPLNNLEKLPGDNFQSALAGLLAGLADGRLKGHDASSKDHLSISVSVDRPLMHGNISVYSGELGHGRITVAEGRFFTEELDVSNSDSVFSYLRFNPPLRIEATVNELVVLSLADLLKA